MHGLTDNLTSLRLLVIGHTWPEPSTTAAGQNMLSYLRALRTQTPHLHFWTASEKTPNSVDLNSENIESQTILLNDDSFNYSLSKLKPDIVVFDRFMTEEQFSWRVAETCPDALRVLNCEDLHGLREARLQMHKQTPNETFQRSEQILSDKGIRFLNNPKMQRELAALWRSDLIICLSDFEANLLSSHFGLDAGSILHLPFIRPHQCQPSVPFEARKHFITIGNLLHEPNALSAIFCAQYLMPEIRKHIPNAQLHIFGAYTGARIQALHHVKKGIFIHGKVEDHWQVIANARVMLAPIQVGAGVKGKLLDALFCATPSVTTPLGIEGISNEAWAGAVCEDSPSIIRHSVALYRDQQVWQKASDHCSQILAASGVNLANQDILVDGLVKAHTMRHTRRQQNIKQSMMMHQTLHASRYLSKYIMAKNALTKAFEENQ